MASMPGASTGGSGSAPEQLSGDQSGPQEKATLSPKPLHDLRASRQEHQGLSVPPYPLPASLGTKMPQAGAAEFYLFFTFYEPWTALATASF